VTNVASHSVSVIDTATNTVVATIDVDGPPIRIALTPDGTRAYLTMRRPNVGQLAIVDTSSQQVTAVIGLTDFFIAGVAVTPDGRHAYVANSGNDHIVRVLDTSTNTVTAQVPLDTSIDLTVAPDGTHVYATHFDGVAVIDTATHTVTATIPIGKGTSGTEGRGIAVSPDGRTAYLTNGGFNSVSVIDTATNTESGTVDVGTDPLGVAVTPDGSRVFVTNNDTDNVSVIDTSTNTVAATIAVGSAPFGVAFTSDGQRAFVTNSGSNTVSVIDTAANTVVADIAVGTKPFALAVRA
jgi:YVTN family beta-propeller protein